MYRIVVALILALAAALPALALEDFTGKPRSIDDYRSPDQWLVVMIWDSRCPACNREAHQYVDFHEFHSESDARVLGISIDGPARLAAAQGFVDKHQVNFPNLIGNAHDVARLYQQVSGRPFRGTPSFLIFDPDGQLRAQQTGAVPAELIERFIREQGSVTAANP